MRLDRAGLIRRGAGAVLATVAAAAALTAAAGTASAAGVPKTYTYDCGSSRGATLNITIYDDRPGQYRTDTGAEGEIPPNQLVHIPMPGSDQLPGGGHTVTVVALGGNPGYIDQTSGVTCDAAP